MCVWGGGNTVSTVQKGIPKGYKRSEENEHVALYLKKNIMQRIELSLMKISKGMSEVSEVEQ